MNLVNFCISISSIPLKAKKYLKFLLLSVILFGMLLPAILHILDFSITNNDVIRIYQLNKINSDDFNDIETIIVGDSSGGNAINKKTFTELSRTKTENLTLTGSWGLLGSNGIIKRVISKNKNIKNIVIIQTFDIWHRKKSNESIIELYSLKDVINETGLASLIGYYTNPKEIWWHIKFFVKKYILNDFSSLEKIDLQHDYILQAEAKYSNNQQQIKNERIGRIKLSADKRYELSSLEETCKKHSLNCILVNGPIHSEFVNNSKSIVDMNLSEVKDQIKFIKYYDKIFSYPSRKIGDSIDHMDVKFKDESTTDFYNLLKNDLLR
jgi:hypothetical protein